MIQPFLIALQFLSIIPLKMNIDWSERNQARSLLYYPLVGLLMGALLVLAALLLWDQPAMLTAALMLTLWVLFTGGLHLDGLADSADAWVGAHGDSKRALQIMKDPQAGPIAVVVLVLMLIIKFSALYSLLIKPQPELYLLLLPPVLGRGSALVLFLCTPYVRKQGLGSAMAEHLPRRQIQAVLILSALFSLALCGLVTGLIVLTGAMLLLWSLRYLMLKHIHGMTGDTLGASIEICEALVLCLLVILS